MGRSCSRADGDHSPREQVQSRRAHAHEIYPWRHPNRPSKFRVRVFQALDGTWKEYRQSTGRFGARRDDIYDAADFIGWYLAASNRELGISLSDTRNQYLAYHEGRTGYKRRSYNSKRWLLDVSAKVRARSNTYERQLRICGRS